jgi:hypothetical protein
MSHHASATMSRSSAHELAKGLGWFSIALGATELLATRQLTRAFGMQGQEGLVQAYGVREIASGLAILGANNPAPGVWSRVAGDGLDIATLVAGIGQDNPKRDNVMIALAAVAGVAALDVLCAQALSATQRHPAITHDYSGRSGFPGAPQSMRGAAHDFDIPRDFRTPEAMRPYANA